MRIFKRVIAVFIVVLTAFLLVSKAKAADDNTKVPTGSSSDVYDYDNDINRWQEYTYTLDKLESYTQNYSLPPEGEDKKIKDIIPTECFAKRGTHVHIGIKYGFFVYTTRKKTNINKSEVFIFKITRSLNKNPENLNGKEVDYTKANRLTYAAFTQFRPILSNNYTYEYIKSNNSYVISSLQSKNDIAINYANHHIKSGAYYDYSRTYSDFDWVALRGKFNGPINYKYRAIGYGIEVVIDLFCDYLKYFCGIGDTAATIIKDTLDDLNETIIKFLQGEKRNKTVQVLTEELEKSFTRSLVNAGAELTEPVNLFKDAGSLFIDVVEAVMSSPSDITSIFSNFVSAVNDAIDSAIDSYDYINKLDDKKGESNKKSFIRKVLNIYQDVSELASDIICMCISIWNECHGKSSETLSKVFYGICQYGTSGDNEMMLKAEKNNRISFYTHYTFDTDDTWRGHNIEFRTILEFRRAKGKYTSVESRYKISQYDNYDFDKNGNPINPTICNCAYERTDHTYNISGVTCSDMAPYHYVYIEPYFESTVTCVFTAETDDGQKCSFSVSKVNGIYKICIYTGEVKGNHLINMTLRGVTNVVTKTTSFKCEKSGNYLFRIDASGTDPYYELSSVTYSQTYYFSSYHYTRTTTASFRKYDKKQFLVYSLEEGKTYSITYKCDCDAQLRPSYTILT